MHFVPLFSSVVIPNLQAEAEVPVHIRFTAIHRYLLVLELWEIKCYYRGYSWRLRNQIEDYKCPAAPAINLA